MTADPAMPTPLAIIGLGCLFPGSTDQESFWASIVNRADAIRDVPPTHWKPGDYLDPDPRSPDHVYAARGGFLDPVAFNPAEFGIAPNNLEATDSSQLLGLMVAQQALSDCGYAITSDERPAPAGVKAIDRRRVGVMLGVTGTLELVIPLGARLGHPIWRRALQEAGVEQAVADDVVQRIADSYVGWQENSFPGLLGNVVAGRIANRFDLGGTNCVVDAACASSLSAIHLAAMELTTGRADVVLTGGVDTFNDIFMFTCFSKTPALSPTGNARPFDAAGDGTVLGEGLGVIVLKRLDDARRDGDRVYAVLKSVGSSSDGKGNAIYAPRAEGQIDALRTAYRLANITPDTIELVEGHGTGTRVGDATEVSALTRVYRDSGREGTWCALGSIKSQIGHTKAAAGAAGLIKAVLALHHKVLPPTIKVSQPLEALAPGKSPFYVSAEKRPWLGASHPRRAAVSAFGFGGSNFHAVIEEADPAKKSIDWVGDVQILPFVGSSVAEIMRRVQDWPADLSWNDLSRRAADARRGWTPASECRLVLVVERGRGELKKILADAITLVRSSREKAFARAGDIFWGQGAKGKLGVLFPGQGAQYPGMLRDLACHFPVAHEVLCQGDRLFDGPGRLGELIYPFPSFSAEEKAAHEETLRQTHHAQPALGTVSLGAWRVAESFGVKADAAAGHSYGELVALCVAGRLSEEELHRLSKVRGMLMAAGKGGAMLAVKAGEQAIAEVLRRERIDLTLANKNAPEQTVLSGDEAEIKRAEAALAKKQIGSVRLSVSAAFHSPQVASAQGPFRQALETASFARGIMPVFANTTGEPYPDDPGAARELLAGQLARPVEWVRLIEAMHAGGVSTFLEVGPGRKLTPLVESILKGREHAALALDASTGQRSGFADLAGCLAALAARGHTVNLTAWRPMAPDRPAGKKTMSVELSGANYFKPRPARPPLPPRATNDHPSTTNGKRPTMNQQPEPAPSDESLSQALALTRESLAALQKMQEQTAQLHRQFLDGQDSAQRTMQVLLEQQQRLLQTSLGTGAIPELPRASARSTSEGSASSPPAKSPALPVPLLSGERGGRSKPAAPLPQDASRGGLREVQKPDVLPAPRPSEVKQQPIPAPVPADTRTQAILLDVVSEKTGYPVEMLELDMSLDADLGIDSIKRVEILSALQERLPDAPPVKPEHLGTLQTLRHIVHFLGEQNSGQATSFAPQPPNGAGGHVPIKGESGSDAARTQAILLDVVSEKTGYPVEMLELDMSLDADLGIDSIKRVEILSALQERLPDAPPVKPEHLGTLQTLRHIIHFLGEQAPSPSPSREKSNERHFAHARGTEGEEESSVSPPSSGGKGGRNDLVSLLDRTCVVAVPLSDSRSSRPMPRGLVWVTADDPFLAASLQRLLQGKGHETQLVDPSELASRTPPASLAALVLLAPGGKVPDSWLRDALMAVKAAGPTLRRNRGVLMTVSRLDGAFGLGGTVPWREPIDGALAGLAKTAAHEWPEVNVKAIDLARDLDMEQAGRLLLDEMMLAGPVEVGLSSHDQVTLDRQSFAAPGGRFPLQAGDVVVISGGARGVTASVALELARECRPTLILLGRSPLQPEPVGLESVNDEASLKRELLKRQPELTPRDLGQRCREILAAREVRQTLEQIEAAGARGVYHAIDVRHPGAVAELLDEVRREHGPIRGLIHGAGVLADAKIEDKTTEQFDRVWETKVVGLRSLLAGIEGDELRVLVLFSSSTARFGRTGQVDYAMANEALNKLAWQEGARRRNCRVVALNWGPWEGGMVMPGLRSLFEKEGVGLIPLEAGARLALEEMKRGPDAPREVVVLAAGSKTQPPQPPATHVPALPPALPLAFERPLSVTEMPVLASHVLDGHAVLPLALILEWLAHAAMVQNPGLSFHGCDDLRVLQGVIIEGTEPTLVRAGAGKALRREGEFFVPVELRSLRQGRETLHARAEVILVAGLSHAPAANPVPGLSQEGMIPEEAYAQGLLFHGPALHAIATIDGIGPEGISGRLRAAPSPSAWVRQPLRQQWLSDPLVIDGSFQLAILWSQQIKGAPNLPCHARRYRQWRRSFPQGETRTVVTITRSSSLHALAQIDFLDEQGQVIARIEGYECVIDPALQKAFRRNVLLNS